MNEKETKEKKIFKKEVKLVCAYDFINLSWRKIAEDFTESLNKDMARNFNKINIDKPEEQ